MGIEPTDQIFRSERDVGGLDGGAAAAAAALCTESGEMKNCLVGLGRPRLSHCAAPNV